MLPQPAPLVMQPGQRFVEGVTVGQMVAPSTATVSSPRSGAITVHESGEGNESYLGGLLDPRLSLVHAPSDQFNWSVHLGMSAMGAELRALPLGSAGDAPIVLALGAQMDGPFLLATDEKRRGPLSGELRVTGSIHPVISNRLQAIAGVGASIGRRRRYVILPGGKVGVLETDQSVPPQMMVSRPEARAEALVGMSAGLTRRLRVILAAQPFLVVASGAATGTCFSCEPGATLDSYQNRWGVALTISAFLSL